MQRSLEKTKDLDQDLITSELSYRRLFETAQDGILLVDFKTGMILDANQFLIDMLGYSKADFLKKHLWEIGAFKDIAASKENFSTLREKRYVRFEDLPLETKSGKHIDVEFVANAYQVNDATIIQCNIRDITARKKIEKTLEDKEVLYRQLFENMISGVVIYETKDKGKTFIIKDCNHATEKIEKVKKNEIIGRSVAKVFPGVKNFGLFRVFQRVWKTGKAENFPISLYKDNRISG
ncbi:PAS domain S-box protein [Candidatus Dojkabacteria bacterium]|nr:PAS domain S-box protein [Candidatus Dojkabacteria bacterium]